MESFWHCLTIREELWKKIRFPNATLVLWRSASFFSHSIAPSVKKLAVGDVAATWKGKMFAAAVG
jgi:hypothetical protein